MIGKVELNIADLFFELLLVAIGNRDRMTRPLSDKEWKEVLEMSIKQSLAGIIFAGVERLPKEEWPPQIFILQWLGLVTQIERRNRLTTDVCKEISNTFEHDGFKACVLKGQANHVYYPKELRNRRTCGDIDVWVQPHKDDRLTDDAYRNPIRTVLEYVQNSFDMNGLCWLHANIRSIRGVPVEVHLRPSFMNEPIRNIRFLKVFEDFNNCTCLKEIEDGVVIPAMKPEFDIVYQMNHIYRHLMDEGVGLRQVVDYYFLLCSWNKQHERTKEDTMKIVGQLGMARFARALMWVLQELFELPEEYLLCPVSESDGRFLLNEMMISGNFGHHDPRLEAIGTEGGYFKMRIGQAWRRCKRNMRFLTSYPEEVVWEPFTRVWHFMWKKLELWKYGGL